MVHLLLADSVPTWTDKELLTAVGSVLAAVTSIAWTLVRVLNSVSEKKAAKAEEHARELEIELANATKVINSGNPELTKNLELAHQKIHELQLTNAQAQEKYNVRFDGARQMRSKVGQRLSPDVSDEQIDASLASLEGLKKPQLVVVAEGMRIPLKKSETAANIAKTIRFWITDRRGKSLRAVYRVDGSKAKKPGQSDSPGILVPKLKRAHQP